MTYVEYPYATLGEPGEKFISISDLLKETRRG